MFATITVLVNIPSVIIVISSIFQKTKIKNIHVLSLSITDALFGLCGFLVIDTHVRTDISFYNCVIRFYVISVSYVASSTHILGICIDRVCAICFNIEIFKVNRKAVAMITIAASWMFAFVSMIVVYLQINDNGNKICSLTRIFPKSNPITAVIMATIQLGIIISTFILLWHLVQHHKQMRRLQVRNISKTDIRICVTITAIVVMCTLFNTPWNVVLFYGPLVEWPRRSLRNSLFILSGFNSVLNPIIYIFKIKEYRQLIRNSICSLRCSKTKVSPDLSDLRKTNN